MHTIYHLHLFHINGYLTTVPLNINRFLVTTSNDSSKFRPELLDDLTKSVHIVVSGGNAGAIPKLFEKNAREAFETALE